MFSYAAARAAAASDWMGADLIALLAALRENGVRISIYVCVYVYTHTHIHTHARTYIYINKPSAIYP